jgi:hypothetical protein
VLRSASAVVTGRVEDAVRADERDKTDCVGARPVPAAGVAALVELLNGAAGREVLMTALLAGDAPKDDCEDATLVRFELLEEGAPLLIERTELLLDEDALKLERAEYEVEDERLDELEDGPAHAVCALRTTRAAAAAATIRSLDIAEEI